MYINTFDRYEAKDSLIHRLDPRVKVVTMVLFIVSNVLLPDGAWPAFGLAWGLVLLTNVLSGLNPTYALKRSLVALPFALAAITLIFTIPGRPILVLPVGLWQLTATDAGLVRFTGIIVRSWLSAQMALLLVATTQFPDMMHALRHLRIPSLLVAIISFMYRYLFVLADEVIRLLRARDSRSARLSGYPGGGSMIWRARVAGYMAGQLFLRSYERSDRVYNAMLARGYTGHFLTLHPHLMQPIDWLAAFIAIVLLLLLQLAGRLTFFSQ